MFNTLKIYVGFILLLTIFSCAKNEEGATMEMASKELGSTAPEEKTTASIQRKLIKDGHLSFETDALEATRNIILIAVKNLNLLVVKVIPSLSVYLLPTLTNYWMMPLKGLKDLTTRKSM